MGHRKSATSEPAGTSANRRRQVADIDVVKIEFAGGGVCGGRKTTAVNCDVKTRFFLKTGRRQQLTRQLITARVQVIASTLPPHTCAAHFSEMVTTLAPARIVGGST